MCDMIEQFKDEKIMSSILTFVMVDQRGQDERGEDVGGVYRDAIGCFWQEFYNSCLGEEERVPNLRHDFQSSEWTAIGRVIVKGYLDLGYFPCMLSKAFMASAFFNENAVSEEMLLHSFLRYVAKDEMEVITAVLKGESGLEDNEEQQDLLDRFGCRKLPTKENVRYLLLEIAHKEIIQRAQYVADSWRNVLQVVIHRREEVSTVEGLCTLYNLVEPTNRKVLQLLNAAPNSNSERAAVDFLKRYIRGLDVSKLKLFLRFTTGADVICVNSIGVEFSRLEGLGRRPITHTCGPVLELPSTYETFPELREEFSNILEKSKWQNDIV